MNLSLYDACVPAFVQGLTPMAGLIEKARAHCAAKGIDEAVLCSATLAPDMWPFAKQIMSACQHSAGAVAAAIAGETSPDMSPPPMNFTTLEQRIAAALESLKAVTPEQIDAVADGEVTFRFGERKMVFTVPDMFLTFALPNFYFHAATAYDVLRNQGLELGKRDYIGSARMKG